MHSQSKSRTHLFKSVFKIVPVSKAKYFFVSRFQESGESLARMTKDNDGKEVLVPLTGSMYVPGKLTNPDKVVVDIGTGYYVEKKSKDAQDYFDRKVKFVTENMTRVQAIGSEKAKIRYDDLLDYYLLTLELHGRFFCFQRACNGCDAR